MIAGASQANVVVQGADNVVEGNYIGVRWDGNALSPPSAYGVQVYQTSGAIIGGTDPGQRNVISGGKLAEVDISESSGVQVLGNYIGTGANGESQQPNGAFGVSIERTSKSNTIGGSAAGMGNIIAFHTQAGVWISGSTPIVDDNAVRQNSIYQNSVGIALIDGANDAIETPVIVAGDPLTGTACANCTVEIFSDADGEGKIFEGTTTADGGGDWTFNGVLAGPHVTATATDIANNTSEFSAPFSLTVVLQGDYNCDGFVDETDFELILDHAAGLDEGPTDCQAPTALAVAAVYERGDVNCDGFVDALDALFVLAYLAEVPPPTAPGGCVPVGHNLA